MLLPGHQTVLTGVVTVWLPLPNAPGADTHHAKRADIPATTTIWRAFT